MRDPRGGVVSRKLASSTSDPTKEESMTDTKTWRLAGMLGQRPDLDADDFTVEPVYRELSPL